MNKKWILLIGGAVVMLYFLNAIQGILLPFVLAFVLAYLLNPAVSWLGQRIGRTLASALAVVFVLILCVLLSFLLLPILQTQISSFIGRVPLMADQLAGYLKKFVLWSRPEMSYQQIYHLSEATTQTTISLLKALGVGLNQVVSGSLAVVNVLALLFISPIILFYVLKDLPQMKKKSQDALPRSYRHQIQSLAQELDKTLAGFLRGQSSVCLLLALYYATALTLIGLDLGVVIGLTTGILSFIPYVGFLIGLVMSLILALVQSSGWSLILWVLGVFIVGNILEGYILTPNLVGRRVGLHPVWILFALLSGGAMFGFLGVLVAVPVAAVIGVLVRHLYTLYQDSRFYKGEK